MELVLRQGIVGDAAMLDPGKDVAKNLIRSCAVSGWRRCTVGEQRPEKETRERWLFWEGTTGVPGPRVGRKWRLACFIVSLLGLFDMVDMVTCRDPSFRGSRVMSPSSIFAEHVGGNLERVLISLDSNESTH